MSIISEAVGGTNVDNCPHFCTNTTKPCGPLAQCIPSMDSYECQCNPANLQCNKAEELFVQQTVAQAQAATTQPIDGQSSAISPNGQTGATVMALLTSARYDVTSTPYNLDAGQQNDADNNSNNHNTDENDDDDYYYDDYSGEGKCGI